MQWCVSFITFSLLDTHLTYVLGHINRTLLTCSYKFGITATTLQQRCNNQIETRAFESTCTAHCIAKRRRQVCKSVCAREYVRVCAREKVESLFSCACVVRACVRACADTFDLAVELVLHQRLPLHQRRPLPPAGYRHPLHQRRPCPLHQHRPHTLAAEAGMSSFVHERNMNLCLRVRACARVRVLTLVVWQWSWWCYTCEPGCHGARGLSAGIQLKHVIALVKHIEASATAYLQNMTRDNSFSLHPPHICTCMNPKVAY